MIFGIKKIDPYRVFLAFATNIPQLTTKPDLKG